MRWENGSRNHNEKTKRKNWSHFGNSATCTNPFTTGCQLINFQGMCYYRSGDKTPSNVTWQLHKIFNITIYFQLMVENLPKIKREERRQGNQKKKKIQLLLLLLPVMKTKRISRRKNRLQRNRKWMVTLKRQKLMEVNKLCMEWFQTVVHTLSVNLTIPQHWKNKYHISILQKSCSFLGRENFFSMEFF